jgi:rhamnogalacturonan endolyase
LSNLHSHSREYALDQLVPSDVTFRCDTFDEHARTGLGLAQDPDAAWPYAQAKPGTFTIIFNGGQTFHGAAQLFVATSMQQGAPPSVALNGVEFTGALPSGIDDPFTRQAVKGAWAQATMLTVDASIIAKGVNNLTITSTGAGMTGFDMLCLEVPSQ